jgi:hypothetical protein
LVGYKEAFPPLGNSLSGTTRKNKWNDFDSQSSNRNSQYSTISLNGELPEDDNDGSDDDEEDIEFDSNIAYQFGNGFKRLTPKKKIVDNSDAINKFTTTKKHPSPSSYPESYLTPPANDPNSNFPFKRSSNRQRTPTLKRKQSFDQNIAESDLKISHVTVFPPKTFSPSEKPRKITPPLSSTIDSKSVNLRLPNAQKADVTRVNYNYHPIIDFFEEENGPKRVGIDRKTGKIVTEDTNWRPIG